MDQIKNFSNHRAQNKIALIKASVKLFDNHVGHSGGFEGHVAIKNFRSQGRNGGLKKRLTALMERIASGITN